MKQLEGVMRPIVAQILPGQLNIDQAAERLKVNRKTVMYWMKEIEEEAQANQQTAVPKLRYASAGPSPPRRREAETQLEELLPQKAGGVVVEGENRV